MSSPEAFPRIAIDATPRLFACEPAKAALLVIDMQHEFLSEDGWLAIAGRDVARLAPLVPVIGELVASARNAGLAVIYTREAYRPDLADCPSFKLNRGSPPIGAEGPLGRFMIAGEPGNDIVPELTPLPGDIMIDKPGAGAFYATLLDHILRLRGITHLLLCGVTADVCVHATLYEGNDRGYECLLIGDATGSYDDHSAQAVIAMTSLGVTGTVATAAQVVEACASAVRTA